MEKRSEQISQAELNDQNVSTTAFQLGRQLESQL